MKRIPALVLAFAMTAALVFSAVGVDAVSEYEYCFGEDDFLTAGALPDGIYLTAVPTTSFGSVTLDDSMGTAVVDSAYGSVLLSAHPDADVYAVVLDKQSGEVLYERAVKL